MISFKEFLSDKDLLKLIDEGIKLGTEILNAEK